MNIRYCIECAAELSKIDDTHYICDQNHHFYNNPKAAAAAVFLKDGKLLVSKRAIEPGKGKYDLPGGFVDYGENAYAAMKREILEETSLVAEELELVYTNTVTYLPGITTCDLVFWIRQWNGTITAQDDSEALEWKPIEFLESPKFNTDYPGLKQILHDIVVNKL